MIRGDKADWLGWGWEGRIQFAGQKGLWKTPLLAKRGICPDFWVTQKTIYLHCHIVPLWMVLSSSWRQNTTSLRCPLAPFLPGAL